MASSGSVVGLVLVGWSMRILGFTGFCGFFFVEILGFRSGSVDFLDAVLCSILYEARVKKLHCLCSSSNTYSFLSFTYYGSSEFLHLHPQKPRINLVRPALQNHLRVTQESFRITYRVHASVIA
jgi:hypothetical protein